MTEAGLLLNIIEIKGLPGVDALKTDNFQGDENDNSAVSI